MKSFFNRDPSRRAYEFHGLRAELTCNYCPEQYSVFLEEREIGYLRLRHGRFRADFYPQGYKTYESSSFSRDFVKTVYEAEPEGDGCFLNAERERYLWESLKAIKEAYERHNVPSS